MDEQLKFVKKQILPIVKKNSVVKAGFFGSFARGTHKKKSDIDILIKLKGRKSLLDIAGLKIELEEKTGREVDLVEYCNIHPKLKKESLAQL